MARFTKANNPSVPGSPAAKAVGRKSKGKGAKGRGGSAMAKKGSGAPMASSMPGAMAAKMKSGMTRVAKSKK
jgi:hypothetical protein